MVIKELNEFGDTFYHNERGDLHREDGPAIEYTDGSKEWCINNLFHRIDGPAVEWVGICKLKQYFLMDKLYSYEDWLVIKDFPLLWS